MLFIWKRKFCFYRVPFVNFHESLWDFCIAIFKQYLWYSRNTKGFQIVWAYLASLYVRPFMKGNILCNYRSGRPSTQKIPGTLYASFLTKSEVSYFAKMCKHLALSMLSTKCQAIFRDVPGDATGCVLLYNWCDFESVSDTTHTVAHARFSLEQVWSCKHYWLTLHFSG